MFRAGQKVMQIKPWTRSDTGYADVRFSECGVVYTIRDISKVQGIVSLLFVELLNPPHKYSGLPVMEQVFPAWNFRPIVERKTDISIFIALLNTKKMREPANG